MLITYLFITISNAFGLNFNLRDSQLEKSESGIDSKLEQLWDDILPSKSKKIKLQALFY